MSAGSDILIIEDDPILCDALAAWLQGAGYGVRQTKDGRAGLAAVNRAPPPALVVTDIHMPGTSGTAVIAELKQKHPGIPIIAISGLFHSRQGVSADTVLALGAARALAKPFKRVDLLRAVTELLGSPVP
jgi:CheY-like chemotaxis protein